MSVFISYYFVLISPGVWRYIAETCRRVRVYGWLVILCKLCVLVCEWLPWALSLDWDCEVMRNGYVKENQQVHWVCEFVCYCYSIWMSLVIGLFFLVRLLNQLWSPPLRLQTSHCSTFRIRCDVQSIAVFCSESFECFPGMASKFFLKLLVTIPVAPIITGMIV